MGKREMSNNTKAKKKMRPKKRRKKKKKKAAAAVFGSSTSSGEPQVTFEDQSRINRFGRLNQLLQDLEDDINEKKSQLANLNDGAGDIEMLMDDDACKIKIGEVFVSVSNEAAEEFVAEQKTQIVEDLAGLEPKAAGIK